MVLMLVGCALRRSELVNIDLEHIRQNGEYKELFIPKAKGGARTVLIEPHIMEAIERVKTEYGFRSGPLFRSLHRDPRIRGNRMTDKAVYYVIRRISALAGRVISPHALRHTACTLALESGAHIVQAQKFLGHAKPETTMVYEHLISDAETSAAKFVNVTG
jgi:integrase/recombinase XerD